MTQGRVVPTWQWHVGPIPRGERCAQCQQWMHGEPNIVRWTDGRLYHVGCLLDRLAAAQPLDTGNGTWGIGG